MKRMILMLLTGALAYGLTACTTTTTPAANAGNTTTANANANTAAKPAAQPATMDAIAALEKSGWEAWKNKDEKVFQDLLSDRFVGFSKDSRMDKAATIKGLFANKCEVKGYSWSDQKLTNVSADVAILTFKAEQDATCDGKKNPSPVYSATVYVREGDKWKNLMYVEQPVMDPKNMPKSYPAAPAMKADDSKPDATTDQLMAVEKKAWEAWKTRDKAGVDASMSKDFAYYGGIGYTDRASTLARWGEEKCEGLDYTLSNARGMQVTPEVMLVTYVADVKGKCGGNPLAPSSWTASFDVKEGNDWKNAFYIDAPRQ
jgi:hypothetical protein